VYLYISDACRQDKCTRCEKNENMPPAGSEVCGGGQCAHTCHGFSEELCEDVMGTRANYIATCDDCNRHLDKPYPPHDASRACKSGRKPHCDCSKCVAKPRPQPPPF
jgi:hypothetical protein